MTLRKKVPFNLLMALVVTMSGAIAGATEPSSASPVNSTLSATVTPSQSPDTPVDCKKKPDDPRCRNKPY